MDLIATAVPFFLLAIVLELGIDRVRRSGLFRANDAINSLSAGILSTTLGYFTKLLPLLAWGLVLENFAMIDMPLEWFDTSAGGIALWVTAALAWDFCYYWFHRFSHEVSILWAAHAVHHQSEDYNLSTALRQTSTGFLFSWIFYLPLFLMGFPLEIVITVNALNLIYQFWVHTQVVRRMGPLDYLLVTPSGIGCLARLPMNRRTIRWCLACASLCGTGIRSGRICRSTIICGSTRSGRSDGATSSASGFDAPVGGRQTSLRAIRSVTLN
jgi:sterol desaturase/sphingolipid hydroxylase (fatty acid hydroxylase superfamily)